MRIRLTWLVIGILSATAAATARQANTATQTVASQTSATAVGASKLADGAAVSPPVAADALPASPAYVRLAAKLTDEQGMKRAQSLAELASMDFDAAHARYLAGDAIQGAAFLERARAHAAQAFDIANAEAVQGKTKGLEKVELPLHSVSFGLSKLLNDVATANRPPIQGAETYFADLRAHILALMFAPKGK